MTTPFVLDATTKSIEAVMSGAAATTNPSVTAAWADDTGSAFTEGSSDTALNGTTPVTLVAAPAAATRRVIKTLTIANIDTAPITLTLSYNDNSTLRTVVKVTLAVNDTWTTDGTFDSAGNLKTSLASFSGIIAPANGGTGIANNNASTVTISGNFATTLTVTGATGVTLPTSGTLYGTASGSISSSQLATSLSDETGTGKATFATKPTFIGTVQTVTAMAAQALDGATANVFTRTLAGSETFTQSNFSTGQIFMVEVTQGSGTTYTVTWFSGVTWVTSGATAPVQTVTSNGVSTYGFRCTGTNTFLGYLVGSN